MDESFYLFSLANSKKKLSDATGVITYTTMADKPVKFLCIPLYCIITSVNKKFSILQKKY